MNGPEIGLPDFVRPMSVTASRDKIRFSICTIVTDAAQYRESIETFVAKGFGPDDCEFLYFDNRAGNIVDAFEGYNAFLQRARGRYIILCHQDVFLRYDDRAALEARLGELTGIDPHWGLCGNAGGLAPGRYAVRISDLRGDDRRIGSLPARVSALDENFIVARREANLAVSRDLKGFHLYGYDLCLVADLLGWSSYVIDFHLLHASGSAANKEFYGLRSALIDKYNRFQRTRMVVGTSTHFLLSGSRWVQLAYRLNRWRKRLTGP